MGWAKLPQMEYFLLTEVDSCTALNIIQIVDIDTVLWLWCSDVRG